MLGPLIKKIDLGRLPKSLVPFSIFVSLLPLQALSADKPYCRWGDCENGIGEKVWPGDSVPDQSYIGRFRDGARQGYFIMIRGESSWVCEQSYLLNGRRSGLQFCATEEGSRIYRYIKHNGYVEGSDYIWISNKGTVKVGQRFGNDNIVAVPVNLDKIFKDHSDLRLSSRDVRRYLPSWFPDRIRDEKFLTESQMLAAVAKQKASQPNVASTPSKPKKAPKPSQPKPSKKAEIAKTPSSALCVEGNCVNGFGTLQFGNSEFIGKFTDGELFGYGLVLSDELYCEAYMLNTRFGGLAHCFVLEIGHHVLQQMKGRVNDGAQIIISPTGDVISFEMYQNGNRIDGYFGSDSNKSRRQSQQLGSFVTQLGNLRRSAPSGAEDWVPSELRDIPNLKIDGFESPLALRRKQMTREADSSDPSVIKTLPAPADKPRASAALPRSVTKQRSQLTELALIAADLNTNRRQLNYNYRLDKVRVDPNKFELVYEFTAMVPIRELDTSVLSVANQTAYCSSSKLNPFRDENMPARWSYVDAEDQTFEVVTAVSDCS